jgi:hypothetical protein
MLACLLQSLTRLKQSLTSFIRCEHNPPLTSHWVKQQPFMAHPIISMGDQHGHARCRMPKIGRSHAEKIAPHASFTAEAGSHGPEAPCYDPAGRLPQLRPTVAECTASRSGPPWRRSMRPQSPNVHRRSDVARQDFCTSHLACRSAVQPTKYRRVSRRSQSVPLCVELADEDQHAALRHGVGGLQDPHKLREDHHLVEVQCELYQPVAVAWQHLRDVPRSTVDHEQSGRCSGNPF